MKLIVLAIVLAASLVGVGGSATAVTTSELAAPVNLQVLSTTEDSITIAWGPSQPSDFTVLAVGKNGSAVTVGWHFSEDTRSNVTYTVVKNGVTLASGLIAPQYRFSGLRHTASFRMCVTATGTAGDSAASCGTVSRP